MCKENLYAKMEKLEEQICRCTRQGLKVMPFFKDTITTAEYRFYHTLHIQGALNYTWGYVPESTV